MLLSAQYLVGVRHADKGSSARVGWSSPLIVAIASSSPDDVLPQVLPRKRPIGGGTSSDMGAALSTGGRSHEVTRHRLPLMPGGYVLCI